MKASPRLSARQELICFLVSLITMLVCPPVRAQNVQHPQGSVDHGFRSDLKVDPSTLALNLQLPLRVYPGRAGVNLPVTLYYSSKLWTMEYGGYYREGTCCEPSFAANPQGLPTDNNYTWVTVYYGQSPWGQGSMAGWTGSLDFPYVIGGPTGRYNFEGDPCEECALDQSFWVKRIRIRMPDGSTHELRQSDAVYTSIGNGFDTFFSVDGSQLKYVQEDITHAKLYLPDGSQYWWGYGAPKYIDRNGNTLDFNGNDTLTGAAVTDTLERSVGLHYESGSSPGEKIYSLKGLNGTKAYYSFHYRHLGDAGVMTTPEPLRYLGDRMPIGGSTSSPSLFASEGGSRTTNAETFDPVVLHQLVLPNGQAYTFSYNVYGEIDKVVYPGGGYEKFRYETVPGLDPLNEPYAQANRGVVERWISKDGADTSLAHWSYQVISTSPYTIRTTAPDGSYSERVLQRGRGPGDIKYGFDDARAGLPVEERAYSSAGQILRRTLLTYEVSGPSSGGHATATRNARLKKRVEIVLDTGGNALAAITAMDYDADQNLIATRQYDYVSVDSAIAQSGAISLMPDENQLTPVRTTEATFLVNDPNIDANTRAAYRARNLLALPTSSRVKEGAGSIVAQISIGYDETSLQNITGSPGWTDLQTNYRGNPTTTSSWLNTNNTYLSVHATYDKLGNVRTTTDAKGNQTQLDYSATYGFAYPTTTTSAVPDPTGLHGSTGAFVSTSVFDLHTGLVTETIDPNGITTKFEYVDLLNRPTRTVRAWNTGAQSQTTIAYDDANRVITSTSDQSTYDDNVLKSQVVFDGIGRAIESRQYESGSSYIATRTQYDAMGRIFKVSNQFRSGETISWTTTDFDDLGRITSVTTPDNAVVTTAYSGNRILVIDQAGKKRASLTDALGRLKDVWEVTAADSATEVISFPGHAEVTAGYHTSYQYDALDSLTTVNQGSQTRYFMYDSLKRLIRTRNPEQGVNSNLNLSDPITNNNQWSMGYTYDNNGNLTQRTDARNVVSTFGYDALNRPITRSYSDGTPAVNYVYDAGAVENSKGRLTSVSTTVSGYNYSSYDALGRVLSGSQTIGGRNYSVGYSYDQAGHLLTQTYPSGHIVTNAFDGSGRTSSVTGNLGDGANRNYATQISYSSLGGLREEKFGTSTPLYNKRHYNNRGQLYDMRVSTVAWATDQWNWNRGAIENWYDSTGGFTPQNPNSGTDNNGNLLRQEVYVPGDDQMTSYSFRRQNYTYDALNRLTSVAEYANGSTQSLSQTYAYDRYGNRTIDISNNKTWGAVSAVQTSIDPTNNRLFAQDDANHNFIDYDAAGNQTKDYLTSNGIRAYDAENRMISATNSSNQTSVYAYDGDGRRIKRNVNGTETWQVYGLGGELIAEYTANAAPSSPQKEYGYRNGELLITAEPSPAALANYAAAAANVGSASSSGTYANNSSYDISAITNGDRKGLPFGGNSGYWASLPYVSTSNPQWAEIDFSTSKSINEIDVVGLQDNVSNPIEPTATLVSNNYANKDFQVQYWDGSSWITVPGGNVTDNTLVWRKFTFANVTTTKVRVVFTRTTAIVAYLTELEVWGNNTPPSVDVASAANGAVASVSGTYANSSSYGISAVTNGDRKGLPFGGNSGYWASLPYVSTSNPQWAEVDFASSKSINEIDVVGIQDNVSNPVEPTATLVSNNYANIDFQVQYWNADTSAWDTVPGGNVTNNNLVWRKFTFNSITTSKIRVLFTRTTAVVAYLTELEAWGFTPPLPTNVALASNVGTASASGTYANSSSYGISAVTNGDRKGLPFGNNSGYWASLPYVSTSNPQWAEVDFASSKSINEIDVVGLQDNVSNPVEPTASLISNNYANKDFQVQYWNADTSAWTIVPGGNVTDNTLVWRKFTFAPVTTSKIRVVFTRTTAVVAYLTEIEAWTNEASAVGNIHWLVTDQLGTPRMVFDETGSLATVSRHDYLPFGEELYAGTGGRTTAQGYGGDNVRQKFTSKERDTETGLDYFEARYYTSIQGRFASTDPAFFQLLMLVDPQRFNLYVYSRNNPLKWVDPYGERLYVAGDTAWLKSNVLYDMAGGQEQFDQYFEIKDGQVILRAGVDTSTANAGVQLIGELVAATEGYLYFAGTDGRVVAGLFKDTENDKGGLTDRGKRIAKSFTCGGGFTLGCGYRLGTTGRPASDQPANLANGDPLFAVIAYNTNTVSTENRPHYGELNPISADVTAAQEDGRNQQVRPVSFFIHESSENLKFAQQGTGRMNYPEAHAHAIVREAAIRKALGIGGGFAGAKLNITIPKKR